MFLLRAKSLDLQIFLLTINSHYTPAACPPTRPPACLPPAWPGLPPGIHVQGCHRNSVIIQGCRKYLHYLKQSWDYDAVMYVKVYSES